ncbi:hypothetical protein [Streptomyces sp. NPDC051000]|uniref:hypothetical protein n=1 Tax=Streptomyces sp. NPDC051000 TaxID=3155520 RepID=UPI0033E70876
MPWRGTPAAAHDERKWTDAGGGPRRLTPTWNAPEFHRDKHLGDTGYREELGVYYGPDIPFGGRPV